MPMRGENALASMEDSFPQRGGRSQNANGPAQRPGPNRLQLTDSNSIARDWPSASKFWKNFQLRLRLAELLRPIEILAGSQESLRDLIGGFLAIQEQVHPGILPRLVCGAMQVIR